MALTPDEKTLLSTNGVSNDVSIIDVDKQKFKNHLRLVVFLGVL